MIYFIAFAKLVYCLEIGQYNSDNILRCISKCRQMVDFINSTENSLEQFAARCCSFNYVRQCAQQFAAENCEHMVPGATDYFDFMMNRIFGQLLDCGRKYSSHEKCTRNVPKVSFRLDQIFKNELKLTSNTSLLFTFLDIATTGL